MAIDVQAENFLSVTSIDQLQQFLQQEHLPQPIHIIGGGSNIVYTQDIPGTLLSIDIKGITESHVSENEVHITAAAGEVWHDLVDYALDRNYGGIENLTLIPGKTGAAPMQNIGAYGVEIKDVLTSVTTVHRATGQQHLFTNEQCQLGYRESIFKNQLRDQHIITSITIALTKHTHTLHLEYGAIHQELQKHHIHNPGISDVSHAVATIRRSKLPDPKHIPNCGSFFKNPIIPLTQLQPILEKYADAPHFPIGAQYAKIPAAWLIQQAGWKGFRNQTVGVHDLQPLVLINHNHGTGVHIYQLSEDIKNSVAHQFGIILEREVNII